MSLSFEVQHCHVTPCRRPRERQPLCFHWINASQHRTNSADEIGRQLRTGIWRIVPVAEV
jgi:hypothetical protein